MDNSKRWTPTPEALNDLNRIRSEVGLPSRDIMEMKTIGDWQNACSEIDQLEEENSGLPVKKGWSFSACDHRFYISREEEFRKDTIESLYICIDPGGGGILSNEDRARKNRFLKMVEELAIELVGGVPESIERFT